MQTYKDALEFPGLAEEIQDRVYITEQYVQINCYEYVMRSKWYCFD